MAVYCGLYDNASKKGLTKKIRAEDLSDGQFHAIEVCEFTASEKNGAFWMALATASSPKVFLDCLWLQEVLR